ncbi:glycoside hydrolase family 113 [Streptomyces sp. NPDC050759]|uniref:glycoside hydrolase family 113 n=1 Tax=Streptomyces sp. NPDC050759 TaxID=3365635 RepID=UPI0037955FF7
MPATGCSRDKGPGPHGAWTHHARCLAGAVLSSVLVATAMSGCSGDPEPGPGQQRQHGFALAAYSRDSYGDTEVLERCLRQIAGVGAEWVQITPTWFQNSPDADEITRAPAGATWQTPDDAGVRRVVALAHERGLKVLLKPHVDLPGNESRGHIRPRDHATWFASYTAFITHYAGLAARAGADQFAVGTELKGVSGDRSEWLGIIRAVRARYQGPLVYAANYDEYARVAFWDAVDLIGVDAYWPLSTRPTHDVRALERTWRPIRENLEAFAAERGRRILFTEAGYVSQRGATTAPYSWTISTTPDQAEQAAGYQALLASFEDQSWWAGVFWWGWTVTPRGGRDDALDFTPRGKAAERVVRRCWTSSAARASAACVTPAAPSAFSEIST